MLRDLELVLDTLSGEHFLDTDGEMSNGQWNHRVSFKGKCQDCRH